MKRSFDAAGMTAPGPRACGSAIGKGGAIPWARRQSAAAIFALRQFARKAALRSDHGGPRQGAVDQRNFLIRRAIRRHRN